MVTQGASRTGSAEYLKSFKMAYSLDGRKFEFIKGANGQTDKVRGGRNPREGWWQSPVRWGLRAPGWARQYVSLEQNAHILRASSH